MRFMRFEDVKLPYTIVIDNVDDLRKHASELPPDGRQDDDAIVDIMCKWCEQQFGKKTEKWDYSLNVHSDPAEDHFCFEEEYQRTLFVLRWS
jgi:hypothetical protein